MTGPQFPRSPRAPSTASPSPRDPSALAAERKRRQRDRQRRAGIVRVEVCVPAEHAERVRAFARALVSTAHTPTESADRCSASPSRDPAARS